VILALALLAEIAGWWGGASNHTETYAWSHIQAHLGPGGFALAFASGLAFVAWRGHRIPPAWLGALLVHAVFWDVAQAQPDAATWFTNAQRVARAPIEVLTAWPSHAWVGEEARFHKPFPLVPAVYGIAFRLFGESNRVVSIVLAGWAVALSIVVTWAARAAGTPGRDNDRAAQLSGWLVVAFPLLQAQSGWLLADIPLCVTLALAWGALLRVRHARDLVWAVPATLPAVAMKVTGIGFVALPALALALPLKALLCAVLLGGLVLFGVTPPRLRPLGDYGAAVFALALHLRSAAWLGALPALRSGDRVGKLLIGALLAVPPIIAYSPVEHVPRYTLPVGLALALALPRAAPAVSRFLVGSGLVLVVGGYAPVARVNQAVNLQEATRALVARGVTAIEVTADAPGNTVPPAALAAIVDLYAPIPVRTGRALREGAPEGKGRWWRYVEPPPWREAGEADGLLLCLYGSKSTVFEQDNVLWRRVGSVSRLRTLSLTSPREVVLYERVK
jgi:hypothetical protein